MTPRRESKTSRPAELFERLRKDHAHVLEEMGALEARLLRSGRAGRLPADVEAALPGLLALLEAEFSSHMAAEAEILYPALVAALPATSTSIAPLFTEHAELRQMLARLVATLREAPGADRTEQIRVQVHDVADLLRLHIRKEESLVFRLAPQLLTPSEIAAVSLRLSRLQETTTAPRQATKRPKGDPR
jgi:hemerythrin-like domain-containing protein